MLFEMNFGRFVFSTTAVNYSRVFSRCFNKRTQKFDYNKIVKVNKQANRKPRLNLILKQDVDKLGVAGQMVQVKRGFGRNYLILNQLAVYATEENKKKYLKLEDEKRSGSAVADPDILSFFENARLEIGIKPGIKVWEVTKHQIAVECRRKLSIVVPVHCVEISEPIRSYGDYLVDIIINQNVTTKLKCSVMPT